MGTSCPGRRQGAPPSATCVRGVMRRMPEIMDMYKLDELTTMATLKGNIKSLFYENAQFTKPEMVNILIHKGREELMLIMKMHKQRHHLITKYVELHDPFKAAREAPKSFLEKFYASN